MKNLILAFEIMILLVFSVNAQADDVPIQGRVYIGATKVSPTELNNELSAQSLKKVDLLARYGAEMSYPIFKFFEFGIRYIRSEINRDEATSSIITNYEANIAQDAVMAVARISLLKTDILRLDVFGAYGGANTTFKIKSASQDGELRRRDDKGWLASPYSSYGGSIGLGYKPVYLFVEGGVEVNKVDSFKRFGTINSNVNTIDLSGSFIMVGLIYDGVSARKK